MHLLHPTDLLKLSFGPNWVQKTKISIYEISSMVFSNMDFNFAHYEIEESVGLIWVKLQNCWFHLQISISGINKVLVSGMNFTLARFVHKGRFGQIWVKITEWSTRFENFSFGGHFIYYGVPFCSFWM